MFSPRETNQDILELSETPLLRRLPEDLPTPVVALVQLLSTWLPDRLVDEGTGMALGSCHVLMLR